MTRYRLEVDIRVASLYKSKGMGEGRKIRVFVQGPPSGHPSWWDLTLSYLRAMVEKGLPVRAIALYGQSLDLQHPGWDCVSQLFLGPLDERFINVVVGFGFPWADLYTDGRVNIAVTDDIPRDLNEGELEALRKYQYVFFADASKTTRYHWPFRTMHQSPISFAEHLKGFINGGAE